MTNEVTLLSQKEIATINPFFPNFELPIHMGFHCDVNINTKVTKSAIIAVSPNLIMILRTKIGQKLGILKTFYISDIVHLYQLPQSVRVEFEKDNLQVEITESKGTALKFAQILYRNYTLFHYKFGEKYELEVSTKEVDKFPKIDLDISPSQRFQFYFSAQCAKHKINYRHDVCRYMHDLIITNNPVFDFSHIPTNALTGPNSVLVPLIKAIQMTKYIRGICWENYSFPTLLDQLAPLFGIEEKKQGIRMIHLVNCDLEGDFSQIIKSIDDSNEKHACFVSYWNLNNNPNLNFENFSHIIDLTLSKIEFLSISGCNIDEKVSKEIFTALANNPNSLHIRHLEIGGVSLTGKSIKAFEKFLKVLNSRNENKINLLDISSCDNLSEVLTLIKKELPDLEILNVSNNKLTEDDFLLLTSYISHSKKLREIDISHTKICAEKVSEIINTFAKNDKLQNVTLKLNKLKLNNEKLLPIYRAFLSQKESCDEKWHSIHLDSNKLNREDLLSLIPLFKRFPKLETLSLSHNFDHKDENNENIGDAVALLLSIPSLKNLYIAGDTKHQLGCELTHLLQSKRNNLERIDISGNKIRDMGFAEALKLIKRSENLRSISLSNNGMKLESTPTDLLAALKSSKNFPSVKFPIFDVVTDESDKSDDNNNNNGEVLTTPDSQIDDQKQVEISEFYMKQRRKDGLNNDLPISDDDNYAKEFVAQLSKEFEKNFKDIKRFTHSCICMKIHLPLPFQRTTETTTGIRKQIDIGKMEAYETDSMKYIVNEECPQGVKPDAVEEDKKEKDKKKNKEKNKPKKKKEEEEEEEKPNPKKKKTKPKKKKEEEEEDEESNPKKKTKPKKKKESDYSDSSEEYRKGRNNGKPKKKVVMISSDESESDGIDTRSIKYKLKTAVPKSTKKPNKRQKRNISSSEDENSDYDESGEKHYRKKRIPNKYRQKKMNDYSSESSENVEKPSRYDRRNKYDDDSDDNRPPKKQPKKIQRKRKEEYSEPDDDDRQYDDDENDDDYYSPRKSKRRPPPEFGNKNPRKSSPRVNDQPVKKRVKESNPKLDGTFLDPYYKKKKVPISKV